MEDSKFTFSTAVSKVLKIAVAGAGLFLVYYLRNVLLPFAVAFLFAYLLNPVVHFFQRFLKNRAISVVVTLISVAALFTLLVMIFTPLIYDESVHLYQLIKDTAIQNNWQNELTVMPEFVTNILDRFTENVELEDILSSDNVSSAVEKVVGLIVPEIQAFFSKTFNVIASSLGFAIVILYLIFIMIDYDNLKQGWHRLIPHRYRGPVFKFAARFEIEMHRYFRGQLCVVGIVTVLYCAGFSIIGLPMGLMLGLLIGFLNLIPYMQILGFLPALCLAIIRSLETGSSVWAVIAMTAAVFVVVQILQDLIITPRIMGKNTGLNPAMILLSLSIWGKLLGFLGLLAALPFTCMVKTYYTEFVAKQHDRSLRLDALNDVQLPIPDPQQGKPKNLLKLRRKLSQ
ncbi:MAG: AI-2E family transporter [Bacteroidales bacterium]|nr:AI-2E family transporter [Bacteroidales bacterium]MBP5367821.1 AI-2E family transporter [Bacteroidales bacterium]